MRIIVIAALALGLVGFAPAAAQAAHARTAHAKRAKTRHARATKHAKAKTKKARAAHAENELMQPSWS